MMDFSTPGAFQTASSGSTMATKPGGDGTAAGGATGRASVGTAGKAKPEVDGLWILKCKWRAFGCLVCHNMNHCFLLLVSIWGSPHLFFTGFILVFAKRFYLFLCVLSLWLTIHKHLDLSLASGAGPLLCHINELSYHHAWDEHAIHTVLLADFMNNPLLNTSSLVCRLTLCHQVLLLLTCHPLGLVLSTSPQLGWGAVPERCPR